jgi:hypothetical protein
MELNIIEKVNIKKINKTFPNYKNINKSKLQLTTQGIYSVSGYESAYYLCKLIEKYFKSKNLIITDGTGNNGSDTIPLALTFTKVNSIELDNTNFKVLENNVKQYDLKNIFLFNDSSLNLIPNLIQDVIYLDAPWTKNYKESKVIKLYMDNKEISELYNEFKIYAKLFIFKVPINYDFTYFIQTTMIKKYYIHSYTNKFNDIKFYFIFAPV